MFGISSWEINNRLSKLSISSRSANWLISLLFQHYRRQFRLLLQLTSWSFKWSCPTNCIKQQIKLRQCCLIESTTFYSLFTLLVKGVWYNLQGGRPLKSLIGYFECQRFYISRFCVTMKAGHCGKGSLNEKCWMEVHLEKWLFRGTSANPFWSGAYNVLSAIA